jgi:hypothetical protein
MEMAVACFTKRPAMYGNIVQNILSQTRKPDVVTFVSHRFEGDIDLVKRSLISKGIVTFASTKADDNLTLHDVQRLAYSTADRLMEDGIISQFEDDDWYGPGYLAEVEQTFAAHPDAIATGKPEFLLRCIGNKKTTEALTFAGSCDENGSCVNVAGPTISIHTSAWRSMPWLRFIPDGTSQRAFPDMAFIDALRQQYGHGVALPLYSTGPKNFALQRYQEANHDHTWKHEMPEFRVDGSHP